MVFRPLTAMERKVLKLIEGGVNSAPLILDSLNKGKKKERIAKSAVYDIITSLCARKLIMRDGTSERPKLFKPVNKDPGTNIPPVKPKHLPNESRVHFTGTIMYNVVTEGPLDRIADSTGLTMGGWKAPNTGMKGVIDRWGFIRIDDEDNKIRYRVTIKKGLRTLAIYPKEIWKEIPKDITDSEVLQWFVDKAKLIADILHINGWELSDMEVRGEPKPGKGLHYAYPNHPLTAMKKEINHMDTERSVDIDSSPGDCGELEGYTAEDGYLLGHLPQEFRRVDAVAAAATDNIAVMYQKMVLVESVLGKVVSCEEKLALIETGRITREMDKHGSDYKPQPFTGEGYQ